MASKSINSLSRRSLLSLGAAATAGILSRPASAQARLATKARIVIVGAGAAGLASASRLVQRLDGAAITLIDARKAHFYQPGFTLVAAGLKPSLSYSPLWFVPVFADLRLA